MTTATAPAKTNKVVLATFASSTSNTTHEIRLGRDNKVYCTCKGFIFNGNCKHMNSFREDANKLTLEATDCC